MRRPESTVGFGEAIIEFADPMPGFPDEHVFSLSVIDEASTLCALRSLRTPGMRFIVISPSQFFPDYCPAVHEDDVAPLGLVHDDEVQILVIVTVRDSIRDATANLLAPIVLVPGRNVAMQVLLSDDTLPLRAPLVPPAG